MNNFFMRRIAESGEDWNFRILEMRTANVRVARKLQQLIGIDVHGDSDVFREW
jgi:hypothetical protein